MSLCTCWAHPVCSTCVNLLVSVVYKGRHRQSGLYRALWVNFAISTQRGPEFNPCLVFCLLYTAEARTPTGANVKQTNGEVDQTPSKVCLLRLFPTKHGEKQHKNMDEDLKKSFNVGALCFFSSGNRNSCFLCFGFSPLNMQLQHPPCTCLL